MPNRRMAVNSREYTKDEERWIRYGSAPLLATLLLPIIIGVILLLKCVFNHCCVRKTTTKDEMYGLEGRMTMLSTADSSFVTINENRNDTHQQHHQHPPTTASVPIVTEVKVKSQNSSDQFKLQRSEQGKIGVQIGPSSNVSKSDQVDSTPCSSSYEDNRLANEFRRSSEASKLVSSQGSSDLSGSLKRASAQHRQLPDLPQTPLMAVGSGGRPPRRSSSVLSHDGTSELYATVGETPFPDPTSSKTSSHYAQIRDGASGKSINNNSSIVDAGLTNSSSIPGTSGTIMSTRQRGIEATPSSDSETYASTSIHHPYAKLKKSNPSTEHPYARVRGANNNDEETDTDNYDLPQFLREERGNPSSSVPVPSTSRPMTSPPIPAGAPPGDPSSANDVSSTNDASGPVPPRRIGRPWRRSSQPNLQNDNVSNFSGDSQDSRGYTSISVREPLSNIRNQLVASTRSYDSHYATVSDDSEEMYAAIDDPNDANYMRIDQDGQPRRPAWLGGPSVSSPIPERREANSPLPPVPNIPFPEFAASTTATTTTTTTPTTSTIPPPSSPDSVIKNSGLPVYAQVTKKSKKGQSGKLPVTPTLSNVSTSSSQHIGREPLASATCASETATIMDGTIPSSSHHPTHRSKRAASLMDNSNPMDADNLDSRRWSKADISYSEFEVVRESIFPGSTGNEQRSPGPVNRDVVTVVPSPSTSTRLQPKVDELVDEDNYNIIPEKSLRATRSCEAPPAPVPISSPSSRNRLDSGNYQIVDHARIGGSYREIDDSTEHCDHYQEINDGRDEESGQLYQEIDRVKRDGDDDDDDEDDEDGFYESVHKPSSSIAKSKKHGYEKIKKKNKPGNLSGVEPAYFSDEEDDDERQDNMYERVKFPAYERLKESKENLSDSEDGKSKSDYEDIGYTRVKSKKPKSQNEQQIRPSDRGSQGQQNHEFEAGTASSTTGHLDNIAGGDVNQLYAQVDKSKKRKGTSSTLPPPATRKFNSNAMNNVTADNSNATVHEIYVNNNEPSSKPSFNSGTLDPLRQEQLYSKVIKTNKSDKNKNKTSTASSDQQHRDSDGSIEYL